MRYVILHDWKARVSITRWPRNRGETKRFYHYMRPASRARLAKAIHNYAGRITIEPDLSVTAAFGSSGHPFCDCTCLDCIEGQHCGVGEDNYDEETGELVHDGRCMFTASQFGAATGDDDRDWGEEDEDLFYNSDDEDS